MKGKVKLVCGDQSEYFPFVVAQNLLYVQKEMNRTRTVKKEGWTLPDDSPYEFIDNGLIKRRNTKDSKKQAQLPGNSEGDQTSEQA